MTAAARRTAGRGVAVGDGHPELVVQLPDPPPGRDARRSRVYEAEHLVRGLFDRADQAGVRTVVAFGSTLELPVERRFASIESVQAYVDAVLALNWVRERWPAPARRPVLVRRRVGTARAHYEPLLGCIAVPDDAGPTGRWALRELVVLHELAHHLASVRHDAAFVSGFVTLVGEIVGPEAGFLLGAALHENGAIGR